MGFGKEEFFIDGDVENTTGTGDQFDPGIEYLFEGLFQPGSPGKVVSRSAVGNTDFHDILPGKRYPESVTAYACHVR